MSESFTSKDIANIISACHKNNVHNIKLASLEIHFFGSEPNVPKGIDHTTVPETQDLDEHVRRELDESEFLSDIEKMSLLVEDPLAYEKMLDEETNEIRRYRGSEQSVPGG